MIAAVALSLGFVFAMLASERLIRVVGSELPAFGRGTMAFTLVLGSLLTVAPLAGQLFRSFDPALAVWALFCLAAWLLSLRLEAPALAVRRPARGVEVGFFAATLLITGVYAWVAWKYQMHDEHPLFGHKSMIEQLRRGEYPVYFPPIPDQDARYHYGFDVLAGALARAYGWSSDLSIDLSMLVLVVFMSWGAAALLADLGRERAAPFAAVAIHLGAGLAWLLLAGVEGRHPRCLVQFHHPSCSAELFPTQFNNVFQHPVSAGVPLMLAVVLISRRVLEGTRWKLCAGILLLSLPALALSQVVYFTLVSIAVVGALPFWLSVPERRAALKPWLVRGAVLTGVVLLGAGLAKLSGGMLTPSEYVDPNAIVRRSKPGFPVPNLITIGRHHLINLGLGFLLFPWFAWVAVRRRTFVPLVLVAFAFGGMLIPHFWNYTRSWDIVKFPSAASFALAILYCALADAPLLERGWPWSWLRRAGRLGLVGSGVLAALFVAIPLQGENKLYDDNVWRPDPLVKQVIDWFQAREYDRHELVFAQSNVAQELAVFGGLSVMGSDYDFTALGIRTDYLLQQRALGDRVRRAMDPAAVRELGVRWIVLSEEELGNLGPGARQALNEDRARFELMATFEGEVPRRTRKIWQVKTSSAGR